MTFSDEFLTTIKFYVEDTVLEDVVSTSPEKLVAVSILGFIFA